MKAKSRPKNTRKGQGGAKSGTRIKLAKRAGADPLRQAGAKPAQRVRVEKEEPRNEANEAARAPEVVTPPPRGKSVGRRGKNLDLKSAEDEVIKYMAIRCPEDVEAAAAVYDPEGSRSLKGIAWRLAKKGLRPKHPARMPAEYADMPVTRAKWREKHLEQDRKKGIRETFQEIAEACIGMHELRIPTFLNLFTDLIRKELFQPGSLLLISKAIRASVIHRAYATVWRELAASWESQYGPDLPMLWEELGEHIKWLLGGDEESVRRAEDIPEITGEIWYFFEAEVRAALNARCSLLGGGNAAQKAKASRIHDVLEKLRHPTIPQVRSEVKRQIAILNDGDREDRRRAEDLRAMLKNDHFSAYSGDLKFEKSGSQQAK